MGNRLPKEERRRISQAERRARSHFKGVRLRDIFLLPNLISVSRFLFALPAIYLILFHSSPRNDLIAAALVGASLLTDVLDGFVARTFNMISDLGKMLDPVTDKVIVFLIAVALAFGDRAPLLPVWLLGLIIIRDLVILMLAVRVLQEDKHLFTSSWSGKTVTFFLGVTLLLYLLAYWMPDWVTGYIQWAPRIAAGLILLNAVDYFEKYWSVRHKRYLGTNERSE